jgi:hypothetical protein
MMPSSTEALLPPGVTEHAHKPIKPITEATISTKNKLVRKFFIVLPPEKIIIASCITFKRLLIKAEAVFIKFR